MTLRVTLAITFGALAIAPGCGKSEPAPAPAPADAAPTPADAAPTTPDAAPDATAGACVSHEVMQVLGSIDADFASLEGRAVHLCGSVTSADTGAEGERRCVVLDLDSGKRTATMVIDDAAYLPTAPSGIDDGLVKDDARPVLKLCPAAETRCRDLHVGQVMSAHFDEARARVVVTGFDEGKINAHVYDAASLTPSTVVPIGESALPDCSFAAFVGDALLVANGACTGGGKAWIADPKTGDKRFDLGKSPTAFIKDGQLAKVEGTVWAFRDAAGKLVYIQDVASGDVEAVVDLERAADGTTQKGDAAFVLATPSELVLIESRPLPGTVFVARRSDGVVTQTHLPRPCP